jgi:2-polyprenyl-3-methyl-5-hydroxy-6-metoxy-1,4-benzoquinol methylase
MKKLSNQKKITKDFFNEVSKEWFERTYDPRGNYLKFPVNKIRKDVALKETELLKIKKGAKSLDIGCGTGQMVLDLLANGFQAYGVDIASKMIDEANNNLKKINSNLVKDVFETKDLTEISREKKYDLITALGLLEYLDTDRELFSVLKNIVKKDGYALVECRNKLFNLFTGNKYTSEIIKNKKFSNLLKDFLESEKFSPTKILEATNIIDSVYSNIPKFLARFKIENNSTSYSKFPSKMVRRQHTPKECELSAKKYGFDLKYVVYYHLHPFPPAYENKFPQIYNKISELMTPLGRTYLGASLGSAFIAVLKKR